MRKIWNKMRHPSRCNTVRHIWTMKIKKNTQNISFCLLPSRYTRPRIWHIYKLAIRKSTGALFLQLEKVQRWKAVLHFRRCEQSRAQLRITEKKKRSKYRNLEYDRNEHEVNMEINVTKGTQNKNWSATSTSKKKNKKVKKKEKLTQQRKQGYAHKQALLHRRNVVKSTEISLCQWDRHCWVAENASGSGCLQLCIKRMAMPATPSIARFTMPSAKTFVSIAKTEVSYGSRANMGHAQ